MDEEARPLNASLWDELKVSRVERASMKAGDSLRVLLRRNVASGATMAFRSNLRDLIIPIPDWGVHDWWIAIMAACISKTAVTDQRLISYRQHSGSAIGTGASTLAGQTALRNLYPGTYEHHAKQVETALARLTQEAVLSSATTVLLREKLSHANTRANLPSGLVKRLSAVLGEALSGRYFRYSLGLRSLAYDLLLRRIPKD